MRAAVGAILAMVLGAVIFFVALAFALPDYSPVPLEAVAAGTLVLLFGAGVLVGRVARGAWPVAVLAAWPGVIIGLGLMASQPGWAAAWLLVPAATLVGGALGARRARSAPRET